MEDRELVQLNIQLPAEALKDFSRFAEQLRRLAEALGGSGQEPASSRVETLERGENTSFDFGQFQRMGRGPEEPEGVRADAKKIAGAEAVDGAVQRAVEEPEGAWAPETGPGAAEIPAMPEEKIDRFLHDTEESWEPPVPAPQSKEREEAADGPEEETELEARPIRAEVEEQPAEAEPVQMEPETPVADAPAVRAEPESQIPAAEEAWADAEGAAPEALAVQEDIQRALETPPGAGVELTAAPQTLKSRWTDVTEELVAAGPAPLTAESVSLAFRRDGRRYDGGFPLY